MSKKQDYNVRAKVGEYWMTCGAAWNVKDGGISLRLNTVPVGDWDGSFLLMAPLPEQEKATPAETAAAE
jgi:hypothetical protein